MTVQDLRKKMGLSQSRFAAYFGLNRRTLQDWECGRNQPPSYLMGLFIRLLYAEGYKKETAMNNSMNFTAEDLSKMSEEELEALLKSMPKFEAPSDEVLATMDVGIYDEKGDLIGIKEGDDY